MAGVKETALNFGPSGGLVGILARPADQPPDGPSDLVVLILNAGVVHRVGPNRMHVHLARKLAAHYVPSLRMDLPGIGDSLSLPTGGSEIEQNLAGIKAAFDVLERHGIGRRFVVFGLCSGADNAFMIGREDQRVVGIGLVDPTMIFPTWKSEAIRLLRWVVRPSAWLRLLRGHYNVVKHVWERIRAMKRVDEEPSGDPGSFSPSEARAFIEQGLREFMARGVSIRYLITGDERPRYQYKSQFIDAFPGFGLDRCTKVEMFMNATHTFTREVDREALGACVAPWVTELAFGQADSEPQNEPTPV